MHPGTSDSTVRVLHVDDEPGFGDMVAEFLEKEDGDIEVETETDAEDALETLENDEIDCVVSDYDMPGMNGLELLEEVRDSYPNLPFILFTGKGSEEVASDAISAGVTDYLQKEPGTEQYTVLANRIENSVSMRKSEQELRETTKRLRAVLNTVSASVFMKDTEGRYLLMNENCREMMGVDEDEVTQTTDRDVFPKEVADRLRETDRKILEDGETAEFEEELPTSEGERTLLTLKTPVLDDDREPYAVCGVSTDITERREREKEMRRISEEYSTVFENVQDPMFLVDVVDDGEEFVFSRFNPAYEEKVGITEEDACGMTPQEVFGEEEGSEIAERYRRCIEEGGSISYDEVLNVPAGERIYNTYLSTVEVDGEISQIVGSARDITGRKKREKELTEHKQVLETVSSNVPVVVFTLDEDGVFTRSEGKALEELGLEPGEAVGESVFDIYDKDSEIHEQVERALEGESVQATVEEAGRVFESWYEPLENGAESDTEVVGMSYDITDREERENELERYEAFIENSSDVITHLEQDGTIIYQSPSVERVYGYGQDETVGDNVFDYVHPDDREEMLDEFYTVMDNPDMHSEEVEFRMKNADGDYVWVEATGSDHTDTKAGGFVVNSREITERKEREEELERYEAFIQNSSDVIMHLDEDGTLLYQSPGTERILKSKPETNVGRHIFEQVHPDDRDYVMSKFTSLLSDPDRESEYAEFRAVRGDGESVWVEAVGTDQSDTEVGGVVVSIRDISDRKDREEELERYEALVENTSDMVTLVDKYGTILYQSPSVERILGYDSEEAVGNNVFGFVHIADRGHIMDKFSRLLEEPDASIEGAEYRFQRMDGSNVWLEASVADRRDTELNGFLIISRDVTERKTSEEELRKTKERLDLAVEGAKLGIWDWDVGADEVEYNDRWAEMLGITSEDADYDMGFREENAHPEDLKDVNRKLERHVAGETDRFEAEYRMRTADGNWKWIRTVGQAVEYGEDGYAKRVVGVHMDIDDRKKHEEETRRLKERLDLAVEGANLGIWDRNIETGEVTYNDQLIEILGLSPDEAESDIEFWEDHIHPDDIAQLKQGLRNHFKGETERYDIEFRMRTADGGWKWIRSMGHVVERDEDGRARRSVGVHMDIDDQKEREKELKRYETFVEMSSDVITHVDDEGTVLYQNPSMEDVFGYEDGETVGDSVFEYAHPDDQEMVMEEFYDIMNSPDRYTGELEFRVRDADGDYVWVEAVGTDHRDTQTDGFVVNMREITERKEREEELERYEEFIRNSSDIITHLDEDGTILYQSHSVERILGHEHGERVGDNAFDYVHPDDMEQAFESFSTLLGSENTMGGVEARYKRADGSYVWLEMTGSDQRDTEVGGIVVNSREITERKEYERELRRSQDLLRRTEQIADTGGWEIDLETEELRWTTGMHEIFNIPEGNEPPLNESIESYHPSDRDKVRHAIENCHEDGEPFDEELRIKLEDKLLWVHVSGEPVRENGEVVGIRGSVRDITELKEREQELERSQDLLRKTERIADTGGWEVNLETGRQRWTEGTYRIHGVSNDYEPTIEDGIEFYHPEDRDGIRHAMERCRDEGEPYDKELRLITADGELRWVRVSGETVYENGEAVKLRGSIRDITGRKEREMELLRNNKAVRELYEITADPDISFEDKIEMVLESCRNRLGLQYAFVTKIDEEDGTQKIVNARGTHDLIQSGETSPLEKSYCQETIRSDELMVIQNASDDERIRQEAYDEFGLRCYVGAKLVIDGELYGTLCFADDEVREGSFTDFEGTLVELMANWVSYELERESSRERLRRQKERLDDFASVVSHDLRSPLTVLNGNLQLAEETGDPDYFESCRDAVGRMEQLTDDLLSLARDVDEIQETEGVELSEVVEKCWQNTQTEGAELNVETEKEITADEGKLQLLLENMLKNSVQHAGEDITITVTDAQNGNGFRVEDDGEGIPEEERKHVLEAGYSTRDGGTGLGMYIVEQVAGAHGWDVEVAAGRNGGAAFDVTGVEVE